MSHAHDPLRPDRHEPNLSTPAGDGSFTVQPFRGAPLVVTVAQLRALPRLVVARHQIVSTGHGASGPFSFSGAALRDVADAWAGTLPDAYSVAVLGADGFGTRVLAAELGQSPPAGPILLAYAQDEQLLTRAQGLLRLIVPSEKDEALRQVKWVAAIRIEAGS